MHSVNRVVWTIAVSLLTATAALAADLPKSLVDPYLRIQTALAADKTDGIADAAKAIEAAAAPLGADASTVTSSAVKLKTAKTIGEARGAFGELSAAIVEYAAKAKVDLPADLRVAYCPMAEKPWLQTEKEIKNPYYGAAMLTCGVFKK